MKKILIVTVFLVTLASHASAEILAVWTNFKGYGHDVKENATDLNFYEDSFSGKTIALLQLNDSGNISYRLAETVNGEAPIVDENPTYLIAQNPANNTLIIFVDGSSQSYTETYLFDVPTTPSDSGSLVYTQTRNGGSPAVRIMHGDCFAG